MVYLHWIIIGIYVTLVASAMVTVLMDNRQPAKAMAWLLVLTFIPIVGLVLYFFFGQNTRKERLISQRSLDQLSKRSMLNFVEQKNLNIPERHRTLISLFTNQSWALPFKDNDIEIFTNGYDMFLSLLSDIGQARHHIHLVTFIMENDELGNLVADILIDKAREGVEVRVIYDDVGCWSVRDKFFNRMAKAGVQVQPFGPVRFPAFTSKVNYRNHRKLCIIDGHTGYIGGMNIARRYVKGLPKHKLRDTHLRVKGGAVYAIQRAFLIDWYYVSRTLITSKTYYPPVKTESDKKQLAQLVTSSPISQWPDIMQGYIRILLEARRYVYIETPYFLPTEPVMYAIRTAALAGIDVRLMVPLHSDTQFVNLASRSYLRQIAESGAKVYLYDDGFNHSKLLICDDELCTCGSTNVDFRSFENNFEANLFIYDKDISVRMREIFEHDQEKCITLTELKGRRSSFLSKLIESVLRLFSPIL